MADCPQTFAQSRLSSSGTVNTTVVSGFASGPTAVGLTVDPPLTFPAPPMIHLDFTMKNAGPPRPAIAVLSTDGITVLVLSTPDPGPVERIAYTQSVQPPWLNGLGGHLLDFDRAVPF